MAMHRFNRFVGDGLRRRPALRRELARSGRRGRWDESAIFQGAGGLAVASAR